MLYPKHAVLIAVLLLVPAASHAQEAETGTEAETEAESEEEQVQDEVEDGSDLPEYEVNTRLITREKLAKIGGAAHRIDEKELEELEYDDPHSIAQSVPGVFVRGEDGFGLRPNIGIRGANSDRSKKVTLMEDGILFGPAPYSSPAAYYFPIASRMVGFEVFKGPGSIQYGPNTIGGAMNLVTRDIPYQLSGELDANFGSYLTGKTHGWVGASNETMGILFEGVHWQSDGFKTLPGDLDTGFNRQEFMLKTRLNSDLEADLYQQVEIKVGYSREHSNETYLGLSDADFEADPYRRYAASGLDEVDWERLQLQLDWGIEFGSDLNLKVTAYRNVFDRVWTRLNAFEGQANLFEIVQDPVEYSNFYDVLTGEADTSSADERLLQVRNDRAYLSQGVQVASRWKLEREVFSNRLETGIRLHHDEVFRDHADLPFAMLDGALVSDGSEATTTDNNASTVATALWALDQISFWRLTVAGGARVEFIQNHFEDRLQPTTIDGTQFVLVPGLGVHYEVIDRLGIIAGVHRGFSPHAPGQPDEVEPETSINYEAGVRYVDPDKSRLVELVGFFNDYNNLLGECTFSSGCLGEDLDSQFNAGEVDVYGLEAMATWSFPVVGAWRIPFRVAYTLTLSEFQTGFVSPNPQYGEVEAGDELPYLPRHRGSVRLGVTNDQLSVNANLSYSDKMREEAGQTDDGLFTDDYVMLDVLASYKLTSFLEVYAKGENLTAATPIVSRRPFGARPLKPLMAQAGFKASF